MSEQILELLNGKGDSSVWNLNWFPGRAGRLVGRLPALEGGEGTGSGTPRLPCCGMGKFRASLGISGVFCLYLQMEKSSAVLPTSSWYYEDQKEVTFVEALCQLQSIDQMKASRKPYC